MESHLKPVTRNIFLVTCAGACVGLYLGFSDQFDDLAFGLAVGGAVLAALAGIAFFLMRDPVA